MYYEKKEIFLTIIGEDETALLENALETPLFSVVFLGCA